MTRTKKVAHNAVALKGEIKRRVNEGLVRQPGKLSEGDESRIATFCLEMELLDKLSISTR